MNTIGIRSFYRLTMKFSGLEQDGISSMTASVGLESVRICVVVVPKGASMCGSVVGAGGVATNTRSYQNSPT